MKCVRRVHLLEMPFDKFVDNQFVHATGDRCQMEDGTWETEYKDYPIEDAENCVEEWDEVEDEDWEFCE